MEESSPAYGASNRGPKPGPSRGRGPKRTPASATLDPNTAPVSDYVHPEKHDASNFRPPLLAIAEDISVLTLLFSNLKGQGEERRGFDNAGRNTMPSESKRFSGTTVLLSVDSCIFRTIGKYAPRRWLR